MKKISILFLLSVNVLFLTGCWKRKKTDDINQPIKINEQENNYNLSPEISFTENNPNCVLTSSKTIFDDGNDELSNLNIENPEIITNENCLNNFIIQEEQNNPETNNTITITSNKNHLNTVLFDFDKFEYIKQEYENSLQGTIAQIALAFERNPNINIVIEGHACNSCGSERYNLELSNKRALTIKNRILSQTNINPEKLSAFGCGTSHLIVHGGRYEQAPNRRVEIFIAE